ncbi:PREDICTED: putative methyltransferase NSUN6 [Camelina sativa]|uniref:Methyltransferase NSUN6 n=1 Tax=Camelina sativa TaxID=90675 RepID=A0ABM0WS59_CAMSA|nr:PREDICTED: putative methyltransferase NSUN6 [Camelina sativa]
MSKARVLLKPSLLTTCLTTRATTFFSSVSQQLRSFSHQTEMDPSDSERYCYDPVLRWNPEVEDYFTKAYGPDHFARISKALTRPSSYSCIRVNTVKTTSDAVIEKLTKILNDSDEGLKLVQSDGSSPITKCQIPGLDYVVFVNGSGPHRIQYDFGLENPPKEVLVSRKCAEAVLRGAQIYVPGVLACTAHVEKGDAVAVCVAMEQPGDEGDWSVNMTRGTTLQGLPTDPYYRERSGLYIGMGTTMLSRAGMFRVPNGIAVDLSNRVFKLPSLHNVLEGEIFLQNLPSIIVAHALDPQRGERILDMCAAPGGKTTAIAILMNDEGEIVAADRSHNKVLDVQKLSAEMGLSCITTCKLDALKSVCLPNTVNDSTTLVNSDNSSSMTSHSELPSNEAMTSSVTSGRSEADKSCEENASTEQPNGGDKVSQADIRKNKGRLKNGRGRTQCQGGRAGKSQGFAPNSFDRVLLDAPCSALGLRPRLFAGLETVISLRNHGWYQRKMFDQAVQLVRVGGILVYSTCTINPSENEAVVRYALDKYRFLSLAPQHPRIGGPGLVGRCEFPDGYIEEWLRPGEEELVQKFDPSSELDTIGFFIAKFSIGPKD